MRPPMMSQATLIHASGRMSQRRTPSRSSERKSCWSPVAEGEHRLPDDRDRVAHTIAGVQVPEDDALVLAGRCEPVAVRTDGQRVDPIRVAEEVPIGGQAAIGADGPDDDLPIVAAAGEFRAVRTHLESVDRAVVLPRPRDLSRCPGRVDDVDRHRHSRPRRADLPRLASEKIGRSSGTAVEAPDGSTMVTHPGRQRSRRRPSRAWRSPRLEVATVATVARPSTGPAVRRTSPVERPIAQPFAPGAIAVTRSVGGGRGPHRSPRRAATRLPAPRR